MARLVLMDNYVGKRLDGRYEIQEIVGVGGMAVVYKAYDNIDDRIVAVKILKDEYLTNEEFRRRFKNESKAIAVLSHSNIVKVFDVSYGDRLQYIVMEYVEGITLKEYIEQQGIVNWKEAVHFETQILRALQHAHDKGIIHRDVKPQNIILLQNGEIKVTDFGIARFSRSDTKTMTDGAIGSVHYISPEQARGDTTDNKADLYSAGVVMYEMLTGTLPFQSDNTVSVAIMQLQTEPKKPREINPDIPVGLEQITMHAMQKNPLDRYQTAAEMLLDIEEFRRNPSTTFDYTYFVDKEPTKFVDKGTASIKGSITEPDYEDDEVEEYEGKSKTLPILIGIITALIILGGLAIWLVISNGGFQSSKMVVPNFINKNYELEIKDNEEYADFADSIVVEYKSSTSFEEGVVQNQSPTAGTKIKKGETITLYVVQNGEALIVPDVVGQKYDTAQKDLSLDGFTVEVKFVLSEEAQKDYIVRTEPAAGERATNNVIVFYVASVGEVTIPDILYYNTETATGLLSECNLIVAGTETKDSEEEKGLVLGIKDHAVGDLVSEDTELILIVSSGQPPQSTATITFNLPDAYGGNVSGILKVFVDGEVVESVSNKDVLLDGRAYTLTLKDYDVVRSLVIYVDNYIVYECKVDFTVSPAKLSDIVIYDYGASEQYIPDVVGKDYETAVQTLNESGFTNISTETVLTYSWSESNIVTAQSPEYSFFKKYDTSTNIVLTVYKYYLDTTTTEPEQTSTTNPNDVAENN